MRLFSRWRYRIPKAVRKEIMHDCCLNKKQKKEIISNMRKYPISPTLSKREVRKIINAFIKGGFNEGTQEFSKGKNTEEDHEV